MRIIKTLKEAFPKRLPQRIIIILLFFIIPFNITKTVKQVKTVNKIKQILPFLFDGYKFSGLDDILKGEEYIGFYTDKDLKSDDYARQFAQTQLILSPVILDINNTEHKFILFDCSDEEIAWNKIKELDLEPLRKNKFGIILARKKI